MEEQPAHQDGNHRIADVTVNPPEPISPQKPARHFSLDKFNRRLTLIISVLLKVSGIVVVILLSSVIYRQLRFDGYSLQAVHVPESFERDGYGGSAIAAGVEAQLKRIKTTVETYNQWDINDGIEVGDYSVADAGSELEVNLVGVGFSIRSMVNLFGASLGIERNKTVTAYISVEKNNVTLTTYIKDQTPQEVTIVMDSLGLGATVKKVTLAAAESILKASNPELLVTYLSIGDRTPENVDKIIETSMYVLASNKDNPRRKNLYSALGWAFLDKRDYTAGIEANKSAIALDPTFLSAQFGIAVGLARQNNRVASRAYFRKALQVVDSKRLSEENTNFYHDIYYRNMMGSYWNDHLRDSALLIQDQYLMSLPGRDKRRLASAHNEIAYRYSQDGQYDSALTHAIKAVVLDSSLAITYTTLAEIYGYQDNSNRFYYYLAKSVEKGYPHLPGYENDAPYNRYKDETRFREIWPLPLPPPKPSSRRTGN